MSTDVLILGWSSIVRRRVLPALVSLPDVERIHVASRGAVDPAVIPPAKRGNTYQGYERALAAGVAPLVYVSLPNSLHAQWAGAALDAGCHVVVDKPAVTSLPDAMELVHLARNRDRCLAEANVWTHHPLATTVVEALRETGEGPVAAVVVFTSPRPNPPTVHYRRELGGGVILDRGSYAVSCGRVLFGRRPAAVDCVASRVCDGAETACTMVFGYDDGGTLTAHFSLDAEYHNALTVIGRRVKAEAERIFTPPADYRGQVRVTRGSETTRVDTPAADSFGLFLTDVLAAVERKDHDRFIPALLEDLDVLDRARARAGAGEDP